MLVLRLRNWVKNSQVRRFTFFRAMAAIGNLLASICLKLGDLLIDSSSNEIFYLPFPMRVQNGASGERRLVRMRKHHMNFQTLKWKMVNGKWKIFLIPFHPLSST